MTPWTAATIFDLFGTLHARWNLPGDALPAFEGPHMTFVNLFGAGVTMWSIARVLQPVPWMVGIDTVGRLTFSLVLAGALARGHSTVLVPFLVLELAFLAWQGWTVHAALRDERGERVGPSGPASPPAARTVHGRW